MNFRKKQLFFLFVIIPILFLSVTKVSAFAISPPVLEIKDVNSNFLVVKEISVMQKKWSSDLRVVVEKVNDNCNAIKLSAEEFLIPKETGIYRYPITIDPKGVTKSQCEGEIMFIVHGVATDTTTATSLSAAIKNKIVFNITDDYLYSLKLHNIIFKNNEKELNIRSTVNNFGNTDRLIKWGVLRLFDSDSKGLIFEKKYNLDKTILPFSYGHIDFIYLDEANQLYYDHDYIVEIELVAEDGTILKDSGGDFILKTDSKFDKIENNVKVDLNRWHPIKEKRNLFDAIIIHKIKIASLFFGFFSLILLFFTFKFLIKNR